MLQAHTNGKYTTRKKIQTNIIHPGNCLEILPTFPDESVDLIITSPPYADSRKKVYGGIHPNRYVE